MRILCLALVLGLAAPMIPAQTNPFVVFPQDPQRQTITSASFVRRPDWNRQAEGFQEIGRNYFRGVGDEGAAELVRGMYHWAADEEISTAEPYGITLRQADSSGLPDNTPTGVIVQVTGLTTPASGTGRGSWIMVDVFATPAALPPNIGWFQGIDFPANPAWPATEGHSLWAADTLASGATTTVGENPRIGAPPVTWAVTPAGSIFGTQWTYIMGALVDNAVLHVGGIDPTSSRTGVLGAPGYGMGGLFPDITGAPRSDGVNLRIEDNVITAGIALVAGSAGWTPPLPIPGFFGNLHIDPITIIPIGFSVMSGGAATVLVAAPGSIGSGFQGLTFTFQAVIIDPATGAGVWTNAQSTML